MVVKKKRGVPLGYPYRREPIDKEIKKLNDDLNDLLYLKSIFPDVFVGNNVYGNEDDYYSKVYCSELITQREDIVFHFNNDSSCSYIEPLVKLEIPGRIKKKIEWVFYPKIRYYLFQWVGTQKHSFRKFDKQMIKDGFSEKHIKEVYKIILPQMNNFLNIMNIRKSSIPKFLKEMMVFS